MTATFERLAELGGRLTRELADGLLDTELDRLDRALLGEGAAELLAHCHAAGVAGTLRELLQAGRLCEWAERTCTEREVVELYAALSGLLNGALQVGPDDPERLAQVEPPPRELGALRAWAERHDLRHELLRPVREVLPALAAEPELTLADYFTADAPAHRERHLLRGLELTTQLERYLRHEAMRVAALPVREALWQRPVLAPLRRLVERLRALLDGAPASRFASLRFSPGRPVQLTRPSAVCEGQLIADEPAETIEAKLYLAGFEQRAIDGACRVCSRQPCVHVQALAARLLDACMAPDDRLHNALLGFVARPSWQVFFDAALPPEQRAATLGPSAAMRRESVALEQLSFALRVSGDLVSVAVQHQTQQAAGGFSSGRLIAAARALSGRACRDHDRPLLELLAARSRTLTPGFVPADLSVLRALCELPRVTLEGAREPLSLREEALEVRVIEHADGLRPELYLGDVRLLGGTRAKAGAYLIEHVPHTGELRFAPLAPALKRLLTALDQFRGVLPKESFPALATYLASLDAQARVSRPASLLGHEQPVPRRFLLRLAPLPGEGVELTLSMRPHALSGMWPPGAGPELVHGLVEGAQIHVRRDLAWERKAAAELLESLELSAAIRVEAFRYLIESTQEALALLTRAAQLATRLEIEWAERAARLSVSAHVSAGDLKVALFKRGAFFFPEGGAQAGPVVLAFSKLLDAARRGERFVRIEGGDFAEIETALFARLREAELCTMDASQLPKLSAAAVPFWLSRLGDVCAGSEIENGALLSEVLSAAAEEHALPASLMPVLREYQREGVRFLLSRARSLPGVLLADEMGLGKTVQSIGLLLARAAQGAAMVVCPTSLVDNWCAELARFAPELVVLRYRGARRREQLAKLAAQGVVVVSFELLARDRAHFDDLSFATQVIDEAQVIRNARTQRARAVASLEVGFRVALSGTPIENRLGDLWSLFQVIAPGLLGSWSRFRARFAVPIERYDDSARAAALSELIAPLVLRRRKDDVASELPLRTEVIQLVALSPGERDLYGSALAEARRAIGKRKPDDPGRRLHILAELTRLRQLACHPRLVLDDARVESSKLGALMTLLHDVLPRGHRVLVFSQFVRHLRLIREALERAQLSSLWLSGSTPPTERSELVARFQAGAAQVFLISLKAGGTGLNLTAADYVVHMDPWWNPSAEDQASDRVHRIGQRRPVTIVKLVAQDTIEERVLMLHAHKRRLSARVLTQAAPAAPRDALDYEALLHAQ